MKKQKFTKTFNLKHLDKLIKEDNSCVHLHKMKHHIALHPYHLGDLTNSVKDILNKRIGKFCSRLGGILCGYKNIKFLSEEGHICDDSSFIHINIQADFFIFKPSIGKVIEGVVSKKSKDHVGCLVHNIFNVSLPRPKHVENWIGQTLIPNSEVKFKITYTNFKGKLPYITGEIIE
jgi:DNA-directed RNA polymerase I subunit RPA43